VAPPCAPLHCVRGPVRKCVRGRPFNGIVRHLLISIVKHDLVRLVLLLFLCAPVMGLAQQGVILTPTLVSFPALHIGSTSVPATITVTNPDAVPHTIFVYIEFGCVPDTPCNVPPGWFTDFPFVTNCTQAPLLPGSSCTVEVTFKPTGGGARTSALTVYPQFIFTVPPVPLAGVGTIESIPALGPWQLLLVAGLLMLTGILTRRRVRGDA
jgi:hypothetical protein